MGGLWIGNGVQNLAGGLSLAPVAFTFDAVNEITPSWRLFVALAYLVLMVSIVGYLLWFHLLTVSSETAASACHFLMPPFGLFFGWLLPGEHVAAIDLVGIRSCGSPTWREAWESRLRGSRRWNRSRVRSDLRSRSAARASSSSRSARPLKSIRRGPHESPILDRVIALR
jgi:hypothetical protein